MIGPVLVRITLIMKWSVAPGQGILGSPRRLRLLHLCQRLRGPRVPTRLSMTNTL
jgi:hypothetical protein